MYTFIGDDVIRFSYMYVYVLYACEERLRLAYRKVAGPDQGRHYFAAPSNQIFPYPLIPLYESTAIRQRSFTYKILRFPFVADTFGTF